MDKLPLLSVIVPVYKGESLFKRCLDSILSQEEDDYEIVLAVNLDADEGSKRLAYESLKDPRFKVVEMKEDNLAKMITRLEGVKASSGSYITFMDNDDYYKNNHALKDVINVVKRTEADINIFPYYVSKKNKERLAFAQNYKEKSLTKEEALKAINRDIEIPHFVWNKVFKRELFDRDLIIFDKKDDIFEDCAIVTSLFLKASSFFRSDVPYYCYVIDNPNSETKLKRTDRAKQHLKEYKAERDYIDSHYPQYIKYWRRAKFRQWTFIFFDSLCDLKNGRSSFFRLWKELNRLHRH